MAYYYSPFRNQYAPDTQEKSCVFCSPEIKNAQAVRNAAGEIIENEHFVWQVNFFPKFEGHTLIVPKRHLTSVYEETPAEAVSKNELIKIAAAAMEKLYPGSGLEFFLQTGKGSRSSVKHLHWHLVPAFPDDTLRGLEKIGQFYTTKKDEEKIIVFPVEIKKAKEELQKALSQVL
jgi:diadenosine tetraphosphate (Ap4A) HIT family hydrolase